MKEFLIALFNAYSLMITWGSLLLWIMLLLFGGSIEIKFGNQDEKESQPPKP